MRIVVAHPGTQHASRLAAQLSRLDVLKMFWTGFAYASGSRMWRLSRGLVPSRLRRKLLNRAVNDVPADRIRSLPWFEAGEILRKAIMGECEGFYHSRNARFQRKICAEATDGADGVVGFDTSSWILARHCRRSGIGFFLDQSIAHPLARKRIWETIQHRYPDWGTAFETRRQEILAAEEEEHALADRIVVASSFTRHTLVEHGVDPDKIRVNPYGVDLERFRARDHDPGRHPLRFVFVGSLQARKGVPLLVDVWRHLAPRDAELWLVGTSAPSVRRLLPGLAGLHVKGPVQNSQLPKIFHDCDVFVFPSLFEGFGLVILEAMASGLPVITTDATAGPDVVTDGQDGFLVPAGDTEALRAKMRWCLENRDHLPGMGEAARRAAEPFTWDAYGERWADSLREVLGAR